MAHKFSPDEAWTPILLEEFLRQPRRSLLQRAIQTDWTAATERFTPEEMSRAKEITETEGRRLFGEAVLRSFD